MMKNVTFSLLLLILIVSDFAFAQKKDTMKTKDQKTILIYQGGIELKNFDEDYVEYYRSIWQVNALKIENEFINAESYYEYEKKNTTTLSNLSKSGLIREKENFNSYNVGYVNSIRKKLAIRGYTDTTTKVFIDRYNSLEIEPVIKKILFLNLYNGYDQMSYKKIKIDVLFKFKTTYDEVIDSILVTCYSNSYLSKKGGGVLSKTNSTTSLIDVAILNGFNTFDKTERFNNLLKLEQNDEVYPSVLKIGKTVQTCKNINDVSQSTVVVKRNDNSHGSGFVISSDGFVLTNFHVIAGNSPSKKEIVKVVFANGEEYDAKIVRFSKIHDLALLKIEKTFNQSISVDVLNKSEIYSDVFAVGAPKSIDLAQSVTNGMISNERVLSNTRLYQLSMSINFGNSGGPLVDKNGNLQGVLVSKLVGYSTEGIGFAVPSSIICKSLNIQY